MRGREDNLQIACVRWFRLEYPRSLIFHVPNGGKRNAREAAKFKQMGVLPGIPDLMIPESNGVFSGLAIELKFGKGKSTDNQKDIQDKLRDRNWYVVEVSSIDRFIDVVNGYFAQLAKYSDMMVEVNLN